MGPGHGHLLARQRDGELCIRLGPNEHSVGLLVVSISDEHIRHPDLLSRELKMQLRLRLVGRAQFGGTSFGRLCVREVLRGGRVTPSTSERDR